MLVGALLLASCIGCVEAKQGTLFLTWGIQGDLDIQDSSSAPPDWLHRLSALSLHSHDSATILIDLGNTFFPGYLSRYSYGSIINEALNYTNFSVKCVTVKDFFQGREQLKKISDHARYTFLNTNILDRKTKKTLFTPFIDLSIGGLRIRMLSVAKPKDLSGIKALEQKALDFSDPVASIKKYVDTASDSSSDITLCFCDQNTLNQYPQLLALQRIDVFVCGISAPDHPQSPGVSEEKLANGTLVAYIPEFSRGLGKLTLSMDEGPGKKPAFSFSSCDLKADSSDAESREYFSNLVNDWKNLFKKDVRMVIASLDKPVEKDQVSYIGNLLREYTGCDLACIEKSIINGVTLPARVTQQDVYRLIAGSPDLLICKLSGIAVNALRKNQEYSWVGNGAKRGIANKEFYSVVLTENAYAQFKEDDEEDSRLSKPRYLFTSLTEAIIGQLSARKRNTADFTYLDRRWRWSGETSAEVSMHKTSVSNPDGITTLSAAIYTPFSNWNLNLAVPLSVYNCLHRIDFTSTLEYSKSNEVVEENFLEFKLDYRLGTNPAIGVYASQDYLTFVTKEEDTDMPVRFLATLGAVTNVGDWTFKLGVGAEKSISTARTDPFSPLTDILTVDGDLWGPALELAVDGSYSIADLLIDWWVSLSDSRSIDFTFNGKGTLAFPEDESKFETDAMAELSTDLFAGITVETGYHVFLAKLFSHKHAFYNLEPKLSLRGTFHF